MWVTTHLFSGMALGAALKAPWWTVLAAALLLHVLLDLVPHWDYTQTRLKWVWASLDVAVSVAVVFASWVWLGPPAIVVAAGVVSALPDLDVFTRVGPQQDKGGFFFSHRKGFPHGRAGPVLGIGVQVLIVGVSAALVSALS